ncbi:potassium-transporting ATPase subunit KdpA [Catellatospora sp. NPDC049111]|uniref:potassium-transporting ATPase subunit KdpA n=1 Tax=Catellatospora sp. NPDC049111 TaxID=3155271 RepID=UPI00340417DC
MQGWVQALIVLGVVVALHVPLGDYMARVFTSTRHSRAERLLYRVVGVDPDAEQSWKRYLGALLAFSAVSIAALFTLLKVQDLLPLARGMAALPTPLALHTAISFTTNTSWQNYAGESTTGHLVVMAGLGTQAFASAAVGMAAALALVRGLLRHRTDQLGNFWVDLVRAVFRVMLPLAVVGGIVLIALGVPQNLSGATTLGTLAGGDQTVIGGPIGSWQSIKLLSGDGGGFFNVNSAHPFENPSAWSNALQIVLMLLVPAGFIRMYGRMVGSRRQGWTLFTVVAILFGALLTAGMLAQDAHPGTVSTAIGGAVEGTETRFGVPGSTLFGIAATGSADGAYNSAYDSFTGLGGGVLTAAMMLGEVAPGGAGSGLYGLILAVLVAVFLGGLMIGRTPEYLRKRIGVKEMRLVALYMLVSPATVLVFTGIAMALSAGRASMGNVGPHGLSEVLYAFVSTTYGNGSPFLGLNGATDFYNLMMSATMLIGRYVPIALVLALAGVLARQRPVAVTSGSLRASGPTFLVLVTGATVLLALLNFLPALALGPIADGLH